MGIQFDEELEARNEMKLLMLKNRDGPSRRNTIMRWNLEIMDVGEKGLSERFPDRQFKSLTKKDRIKEHRLELAHATQGRPNPFLSAPSNGDNPMLPKPKPTKRITLRSR
jgi:hypothetical protein